MEAEARGEQDLRMQIDQLRSQFPNTQDLYREVCALLFFRHGQTPTANRLYQLVRKGSMTAPAEALAKFWSDLREKSRVRIEHPDLPLELADSAGAAIAALWVRAQELAQASLAAHAEQASAEVRAARDAAAEAQADLAAGRLETQSVRQDLTQALRERDAARDENARERQRRESLELELRAAVGEQVRLREFLDSARIEMAAELEKVRGVAALAETRFRAAEERALLEIDRERSISSKWQKELDKTRLSLGSEIESRNRQLTECQVQLAACAQKAGVLEGNVQTLRQGHAALEAKIEAMQQRWDMLTVELGLARQEAEGWKARTEESERQFMALQKEMAARKRKKAPPPA